MIETNPSVYRSSQPDQTIGLANGSASTHSKNEIFSPRRSPFTPVIFRGEEFPCNFCFISQYEDPQLDIANGTVIGLALSYIRDLSNTPHPQLIEDDLFLVWIEKTVVSMAKSRYESNGFHPQKTNGNGRHP